MTATIKSDPYQVLLPSSEGSKAPTPRPSRDTKGVWYEEKSFEEVLENEGKGEGKKGEGEKGKRGKKGK